MNLISYAYRKLSSHIEFEGDMNIKAVCNICGQDSFKLVANTLRDGSSTHKVYCCDHCGHVQLLPRPTPEEDQAFYDANKQDKAVRLRIDVGWERRSFEVDTQRRANFVAGLKEKSAQILDVGAGYGFFLAEMSRRGYGVCGIEVSEERRSLANTVTDAPILPINLLLEEECDVDPADVVTLFHVLEHMADPIHFARRLRQLVKPGGMVVCEVPNVDELLIQVCADYRDFYWIRAHINYFNAKSLETVLSQAGFKHIEVQHVQRYGVENLCNWLRTGQPQLDSPRFKMISDYRWLEEFYRQHLSTQGQTDTLIAIGRNEGA